MGWGGRGPPERGPKTLSGGLGGRGPPGGESYDFWCGSSQIDPPGSSSFQRSLSGAKTSRETGMLKRSSRRLPCL